MRFQKCEFCKYCDSQYVNFCPSVYQNVSYRTIVSSLFRLQVSLIRSEAFDSQKIESNFLTVKPTIDEKKALVIPAPLDIKDTIVIAFYDGVVNHRIITLILINGHHLSDFRPQRNLFFDLQFNGHGVSLSPESRRMIIDVRHHHVHQPRSL